MNNLLIVALMAVLTVIGFVFISGASANPTGKVTEINTTTKLPPIIDGKQDLYLKATQAGVYNPTYLKVKKDIPVRIHYSADEYAGCGREVIFPAFKIRKLAPSQGEALIEFTPTQTGRFPFHCSMKMFNGTIEVVK